VHVFCLKGDFATLDAYTPLLFELGARGLEEKPGEVWAYFPQRLELPLPGEWLELPDTDWLEAWRRDLKPVKAGPFVVLAPWHGWTGDELRIVLEPGMAFGTGHHETTRMALEALGERVGPGMRVLDLGTGSGILAIAAAKLGAEAEGVDIDAAVIPQALENARVNGVSPRLAEGTLESVAGPYALVVANLYAELHARLASGYAKVLEPGGTLILTGILAERETPVREALEAEGFALQRRRQEGEWVLLVYGS
jgi:ribosomal protein L11 methyltransferase